MRKFFIRRDLPILLWFIAVFIFTIISIFITICLLVSQCSALDFSVTGSVGYNRATFGSGSVMSPTGSGRDSDFTLNLSAQIKWNTWEYRPTLEIDYRRDHFDFGTMQAPVQRAKPELISAFIGVTRDFDDFSVYVLGGITHYNAHAALIEARPYIYHGTNIQVKDNIPTFKLGIYKLWNLGPLGVGPEFSTTIYTKTTNVERCRNMKSLPIVPMLGLRAQW